MSEFKELLSVKAVVLGTIIMISLVSLFVSGLSQIESLSFRTWKAATADAYRLKTVETHYMSFVDKKVSFPTHATLIFNKDSTLVIELPSYEKREYDLKTKTIVDPSGNTVYQYNRSALAVKYDSSEVAILKEGSGAVVLSKERLFRNEQ